MKTKTIQHRINLEKTLLNFILKFLSPTNSFVIYLSQHLDKLIVKGQLRLYSKYKRNHKKGKAMPLRYTA
jgi:Spo0E like sporulation regulatory protein.